MRIAEHLINSSELRLKRAGLTAADFDIKGDRRPASEFDEREREMEQLLGISKPAVPEEANRLESVSLFADGLRAARSVCRIQIGEAGTVDYATGFMVAPSLLMTSHHVLPTSEHARRAVVEFNYELGVHEKPLQPVSFQLDPEFFFYTNKEFNYATVAISSKGVNNRGLLGLSRDPGVVDEEYLTMIHHPAGQAKQVGLRANKLLKSLHDRIWYSPNGASGSAGAPIFNRHWQVVAIHTCGIPRRAPNGDILTNNGRTWNSSMDETSIAWLAQEGVRISAVLADLKERVADHPLLRRFFGIPNVTANVPWIDPSDWVAASVGVGDNNTVYARRDTLVEASTKKDLTYTLWYGTNRLPKDPSDISKGFSGNRDDKVHLGICKVYVPESHKIGSTGSSWWKRLVTGTDDRLKITSIQELAERQFWLGVADQLQQQKIGDRDAVIFVHGYNVSFEGAALRSAQLGTDLAVRGCMAFFSWPSRGQTKLYVNDAATIDASEPYITQFMIDFAQRSGASKIHLIAHSMGNRAVLRAVNTIASTAAKRTGKSFDQIILAAADVDADTFRQLYKAYRHVSRRTTLYVSSRDRAVEASEWLHGYPRVGLAPPIIVLPGVDTVLVTNADVTMLGHGYVADSRGVLTDIHALLSHGAAPDKRFGLQPRRADDDQEYWVIGE